MSATSKTRLATLVYALGIVVVSVIPSTGVSMWNLDKVGHYIAYAGLAILVSLSFESLAARVAGLIGAIALGASLEVVQSFVPGRDMSLIDEAVNTLGVLTGAVVFLFRQDDLRRRTTALVGQLRGRKL